jgi:hypothetical protein
MSAYQKQNLEKLCKFIGNINKSVVLLVLQYKTPMFTLHVLILFILFIIFLFVTTDMK